MRGSRSRATAWALSSKGARGKPQWQKPRPFKWDYTRFGVSQAAPAPDRVIDMVFAKDNSFNRRTGIADGYAKGSHEQSVNNAIDNLRTAFVTAARLSFAKVAGNSLSASEINKTLDTDSFRKFMTRAAKAGNFAHFLVAAKADALRPGSAHTYTVEYNFLPP